MKIISTTVQRGYGGVCNEYCQDCYFFGRLTKTCDYWMLADQMRGCPPGNGCTRKLTIKEHEQMAAMSKWDKDAGKKMWQEGRSDKEIAAAFGVSVTAVNNVRRKCWEAAPPTDAVEIPPTDQEENAVEPVRALPGLDCPVPVPADDDAAEESAKIMIQALEQMTGRLTGMEAVMTAQIMICLWKWETQEDLLEVKAFLDYLIERAADS